MKKQTKQTIFLSGLVSLVLMLSLTTSASADAKQTAHWITVSEDQTISGSIYPSDAFIKVGHYQDWVLELHDTKGDPVYPARISVGGGMPGHGHGLPTQPQVTDYLDKGRYLIEGLKFNMSGDWVLMFGVESPQATDRLEFELVLDY